MSVGAYTPEAALGLLVRDVARLLRRRFEHGAHEAALSLSRNQCFVLTYLAEAEGLSQVRLAEVMDVEPIVLVRLIDRLAEAKLIERRPDARDRRVRKLYLTRDARPVVERIRRLDRRVGTAAFADLSDEERATLISGLEHLKMNLSKCSGPRTPKEDERIGVRTQVSVAGE